MPALRLDGVAFYLICAILGAIILAIAASAWRRLGKDRYRRLALAGAVLFLGRMVGLAVLWSGLEPIRACQEWALESLTVAAFLWAFLHRSFARSRQASLFLGGAAVVTGAVLVLCILLEAQSAPLLKPTTLWFAVLSLLNAFAVLQWVRHSPHFSLWLAGAFLLSSLGALSGLLGYPTGALLGHLTALILFAVETYRAILAGFGGYGRDLEFAGKQTLQQTQEMVFLLEVSRAITASLDLPVILERVSESVARAVNADWAYVLLPVEGNPQQLMVAARYGWWGRRWMQDSQLSRRAVIGLSDFSLLRHAISRQRQVVANLPEDYEQFEPLHDRLARPQSGPALVQPIYLQHRLLGALVLGRIELSPRQQGEGESSFDEADAELCRALAAQVATAIDHARRYQDLDGLARRLAEDLQSREREITKYQAVLESIDVGVVVIREGGDAILTNAAAERILDPSREEVQEQAIKDLYAELLRSGVETGGDLLTFRWGKREVVGNLTPVRMPDGRPLGYVALLRDVTGELQAERVRAKWLANVAHELQNLLFSTREDLDLLRASAVHAQRSQPGELLDLVSARTERMASLAENLTVVSEMDRGAVKMARQPVDLGHVIEEAVQAVRSGQEVGPVELATNVPADLGLARGDPHRLRQIMDNLLDIAVRNMPEGGRISVWAAEAFLEDEEVFPRKYLVVSIRDSGMGIPLQEQDRVSERLYRLDSLIETGVEGGGMELTVTKSLVEAQGGRIWVESQPGAGTTFSFTIPASVGP